MTLRPDYTAERIGRVIVVEDLDQGGLSVTNGADSVIGELAAHYPDLSECQVVYRDSLGRWDGMTVTPEGGFGGFYPLNTPDREEAIRKALGQ